MVVGPESATAHPGPVCYRKGGYLTVTDANVVLGRFFFSFSLSLFLSFPAIAYFLLYILRLQPKYFPKILGKNQDESLDTAASIAAMEAMTEVNRSS